MNNKDKTNNKDKHKLFHAKQCPRTRNQLQLREKRLYDKETQLAIKEKQLQEKEIQLYNKEKQLQTQQKYLLQQEEQLLAKTSNLNNHNKQNLFFIIGSDVKGYILSFVSPLQLRQISRISWLFSIICKKPACNYLLNTKVLKIFMKKNDKHNIICMINNGNFWNYYNKILKLKVTYKILHKFLCYTPYNIIQFWNKFDNMKQLEITNNMSMSLNNILNKIANSVTMNINLEQFIYNATSITTISLVTLQLLYKLKNLKTLNFKVKLFISHQLRNTQFINDNLVDIQNYILHIKQIMIIVAEHEEGLKPSLLNIFFHQNIETIKLKLPNTTEKYFIEDVNKFNTTPIYTFSNKYFMNLTSITLALQKSNPRHRIHINTWFDQIINCTINLTSIILDCWTTSHLFIGYKIFNLQSNPLFKIISNNNELCNVIFCNINEKSCERCIETWTPLFVMQDMLLYNQDANLLYWIKNKFQRFEFNVILSSTCIKHFRCITRNCSHKCCQRYYHGSKHLSNDLFPRINIVIKNLKILFKRYNIKFSIVFKIPTQATYNKYIKHFLNATIIKNGIKFENDKQSLITNFFDLNKKNDMELMNKKRKKKKKKKTKKDQQQNQKIVNDN